MYEYNNYAFIHVREHVHVHVHTSSSRLTEVSSKSVKGSNSRPWVGPLLLLISVSVLNMSAVWPCDQIQSHVTSTRGAPLRGHAQHCIHNHRQQWCAGKTSKVIYSLTNSKNRSQTVLLHNYLWDII